MRLLLIRHGQTPSNVSGAIDTAFPGAALTALGQAQARAVAEALREVDVASVHASTLVRTQLTGAPLAEARRAELNVHEGLREIGAGDLEMRTDEEAVRGYAECVADWMCGDLDRAMPGGSTGHEFLQRYDEALRAALAAHRDDATVAAFSHGAAMRVWTTHAGRLDPHVTTGLRMPNTGMVVLDGSPDRGWTVEQWPTTPLGGPTLEDARAHDVTAESAEDAVEDAVEDADDT